MAMRLLAGAGAESSIHAGSVVAVFVALRQGQ
jgi:hypothetical protein